MALRPTRNGVLTEPFKDLQNVDHNLIFQQDNLPIDNLVPEHYSGGAAHATDQTIHPMLEDGIEEIPRLRKPTRNDWREIEPVIANLYRNHTLEEVKGRLAEEYRLRVTTKMLKDKRRNWKLDKNIKPQEMKAIIRKKFERERIGKASVFRVRGKEVPQKKISRYLKAIRRSVLDEILARAPTPPELICYTPLASPLTTPRVLETPELIVKLVQDHMHGSLDATIWMQDHNSVLRSVKDSSASITEFFEGFMTVIEKVTVEYDSNVWRLLDPALACIEELVTSEDPFILPYLFHVIREIFLSKSALFLASALLKQFSAMSDAKLPSAHPFNRIFSRCLELDASNIIQSFTEALCSQADVCSKRLGRFEYMTLNIQICTISLGMVSSQRVETSLNLLREIERELGPSDPRAFDIRRNLAIEYSNLGCFHEAIETIQKLLTAIFQGLQPRRDEHLFEGLYELAMAQRGLSATKLAEQNIRRAIHVGASAFGWEHGGVLSRMFRLEEWLRDWGREAEAENVRADIDGIVEFKRKKIAQQEEKKWRRCKAVNPSLVTPPLSKRQLDVVM